MAGFSKIYCIGELGGFQGADGINPIRLQIWVGDGDRQWLEPHYFEAGIRPLGDIRVLIPAGPNHPHSLIDACITFYPTHFKRCSSLETVAEALKSAKRLDFHLGGEAVPKEWSKLREEAWPHFRTLNIFEAELRPATIAGEP